MKEFEAVIGLEVHVQLQTESKIFSNSSASFGGAPNTHVEPVTLGLPGVLPVLNRKVVDYAMRMGFATNCTIADESIFARKHYFYPDLPKGYQISQYEKPICEHGYLDVELDGGVKKTINIISIHLEEDAGKSVHNEDFVADDETLIDVNRCGVPLIEIVSAPDMRSPKEAGSYLEQMRQIVRYVGVSDGNMSEGSLRCDANVSVRPVGQDELGVKTELKNMNSISGVEKALEYEIQRQIRMVKSGEQITQQTLLWDADANVVRPMRTKEYAHDYRYFPDPDLVPLVIDDEWRALIKRELPELPRARRDRFVNELELPEYDAGVLTAEKEIADYFEAVNNEIKDPKTASNWVMGKVMRVVNESKTTIRDFPISPERLGKLLKLLATGAVNGKIAKRVFDEMLVSRKSPQEIVEEKGLSQISNTGEIEKIVDEVLANHSSEVERYKNGEQKLIGFFVGQVMRASRGKANPKLVNEILASKL